MKLEIFKIGQDGDGIAYDHHKPVFVKNALISEVVNVKIKNDFGSYKTAEIISFIQKSNERNDKLCKSYHICGGCNIGHCKYEGQCKIKVNLLKASLLKYARIDADVEIVPSIPNYYRNSLKLPFCNDNGKIATALFQEDSNHFVKLDVCLNHEKILEETRNKILELVNAYHLSAYDRYSKKGLRTLYMRHLDNQIQICFVTGDDVLPKDFILKVSKLDKVISVYQSINSSKTSHNLFGKKMLHLAGASKISFTVNDIKASLSIRSFYQMNTLQASKMYEYVISLIQKDANLVVEAYCGIGIMSLLASKKAKKVIGIEIIEDAIVNAKANAKMNDISNVEFICGDSGEELRKISKNNKIDYLIVDPPRGGLDDLMLETILRSKIKNILYVSCNDVSLSCNIDILSKRYTLRSIQAFDLFPNTTHVETVCLLTSYK